MKWIVVWKGKDSGRCVRSLPMERDAAHSLAVNLIRYGWTVQIIPPNGSGRART